MYPVRAPLVPKIGVIVHPPRRKNCKQTLKPLNTILKVTGPKSARVQKPKGAILPELEHVPGEPYFTGPISPNEVMEKYSFLLTERETLELSSYNEIYYLRLNPPHSKATPKTIPNFFHFTPNDHVAFRYQQQEVLGKGSFGTVIKCFYHKSRPSGRLNLHLFS